MGDTTKADCWFERCLQERGHDPGQHEPDLSSRAIAKAPDYLPTSATGDRAGFEVKSFSPKSMLGRQLANQRSGVFDGKRLITPIRNQLGEAAGQLKGLAGEMPLVIVLANPEGGTVDMTVGGVIEAMYGNFQYAIPINPTTGAAAGPGRLELGRDGKFTTRHQYVSAVVILRCRQRRQDAIDALVAEAKAQPSWGRMSNAERANVLLDVVSAHEHDLPDGEYFPVDVIDTISAIPDGRALELPDSWFPGPFDTRWRHNGRDAFEQVQGRVKP